MMPQLPWMPQFDYDTSSSWAATLPMRIWSKSLVVTGGADRSATWAGASYEISRAYLLRITIRYFESEENEVFSAIDYMRTWPNTGTFWPDQLVTGTSFTVDVELPRKGDELVGRANPDFEQVREIDIVLRNVAGTAWPMNWFD